MQSDVARIWPYVIAILTVVLVYRRLRRSFGRQRIRPIRMRVRIGLLLVLGGSMLPLAFTSGQFLMAELAGATAGVALGVWGAQRTRYKTYAGQLHYIPHTYSGIAVSLLLVGRLVYHMVEFYSSHPLNDAGSAPAMQAVEAPMTVVRNPFTVGLFLLVVGYYVCYYSLVLWRSQRIGPEDLEVDSTSTAASS